jgi:hypothetical protein
MILDRPDAEIWFCDKLSPVAGAEGFCAWLIPVVGGRHVTPQALNVTVATLEGTRSQIVSRIEPMARGTLPDREFLMDFALERRGMFISATPGVALMDVPAIVGSSGHPFVLHRCTTQVKLLYDRLSLDPGFIGNLSVQRAHDAIFGRSSAALFNDAAAEVRFTSGDSLPVSVRSVSGRFAAVLRIDSISAIGIVDGVLFTWDGNALIEPESRLTRICGWQQMSELNGQLYSRRYEAEVGVVIG